MDTILQDLRYGIRMLVKSPGFAAVAILTLALGIGANTAIFSVINEVLLRPLPFPRANDIVIMGPEWHGNFSSLAPADFLDVRSQNHVFDSMAGARSDNMNLAAIDRPERVAGTVVTPDFFKVFGVQPRLGRGFLPSDGGQKESRALIIGDALWRRQFSANAAELGSTVRLNGESFILVGVMPPGFNFPDSTELWIPPRFAVPEHPLQPQEDPSSSRGTHYFDTYARLRSGVSLAQAQAEVTTLLQQIANAHPGADAAAGARVERLRETIVGKTRPALLVILGAVGMVLLIACANVASLMLARGASRLRELTIRRALGATRARVIRQLLIESVCLSLLGGAVGVLLAYWCFGPLTALVPEDARDLVQLKLDFPLLAFTFSLSIFVGVLFGLAPAWQSSPGNLNDALKTRGSSAGIAPTRTRAQNLLVLFETAVALVLLAGAGLLVKSFVRLHSVSAGFDPRNVMTLRVSLNQAGYETPAKRAQFARQALEEISGLPGVRAAAIATRIPLASGGSSRSFVVVGRTYPPDSQGEPIVPDYSSVSPGFFQTLGIPFLAGRDFTARDDSNAPGAVIINYALAHEIWPNENPIGKQIQFGTDDKPREIVGVVADVHQHSLSKPAFPGTYVPYAQDPWTFFSVAVRGSIDATGLAAPMEEAVHHMDANLPVYDVRKLELIASNSISARRLQMMLLGIFAVLAVFLAVVGIYGVMSFTVGQRTNEIGIRMALGAQPRDVLKQVLWQGARLAGAGAAIGLAAAFVVTRLMSSLLFEVNAIDPAIYAGVTTLLVAVALAACYVPARRAMRVDPIIALRYE